MPVLTQKKYQEILDNAPQGTSPNGIKAALKNKGYTVREKDDDGFIASVFEGPRKFAKGISTAVQNFSGATDSLDDAFQKTQEQQQRYQKMLREQSARGEDTTAIEKALKETQQNQNRVRAEKENIDTAGNMTTKEVLGSTLQTAAFGAPGGFGTKLLTKAGSGAGLGYGFDVSESLMNNEGVIDTLTPGAGTIVGGSLPFAGKAIGTLGDVFGLTPKALQEGAMKMTPAEQRKLGQKADDIVDYVTKNKISGTPAKRAETINKHYREMENTIQDTITSNNVTFGKKQLIEALEDVPEEFIDDPYAYREAQRQTDDLIEYFQKIRGDVDASTLNNIKRNLSSRAYSKNNTEVLNDSLFSLSNRLYGVLEKKVPGLKKLNKDYSTIITARKALEKASSRNQAGIIGRGISSAAGLGVGSALGTVTGPVGGYAGATLGGIAGDRIANSLVTPVTTGTAKYGQIAQDILQKAPEGTRNVSQKFLQAVIGSLKGD